MNIWTLDNTDGYSQERLDFHNENYESWRVENKEKNTKEIQQKYWDTIMIHG